MGIWFSLSCGLNLLPLAEDPEKFHCSGEKFDKARNSNIEIRNKSEIRMIQ
jgi:hypothetical protein